MIMKNYIKNIFFAALAIVMMASCGEKEEPLPINPPGNYAKCEISGYVTCEGKGIEGVTVSDGVEVTRTDAEGHYSFVSKKKYGYVFISIPGGYMCEMDGALPEFWQPIAGKTQAEEHSFNLVREDNDEHILIASADYHLADRYSSQDIRCFDNLFIKDVKNLLAENSGKKVYNIALGDMTWDIFWDTFSLTRYQAKARSFPLPTFHVIGNHDYDMSQTNDFKAENVYRKNLGPTFYSFNLGKCHYVVLDDMVYTNTITGGEASRSSDTYVSDEQLEWLEKDLENVSKDTPVFVCMHCSSYTIKSVSQSGLISVGLTFDSREHQTMLVNLLKEYTNVHFLSGDTHINQSIPREKMPVGHTHIYEHNIAAVCASWWWTNYESGNSICKDGSEGGYMIFTNNDNDVRWQYKSMKYDVSKQFRTYDFNSIKAYVETDPAVRKFYQIYPNREKYTSFGENDVLFNVWNWDPTWTVSVTENGAELPVKQHYIEDPLHTVSYDIPRTYTNGELTSSFRTIKTHHMFSVHASSATSTLEFTVTDGFGNVHTETMTRPKAFNADID